MEFIWKTSPSLGSRSDLFTSVLPNIYWPPSGFCFDVNCYEDPLDNFNVEQRSQEFISHVKAQGTSYAGRHTIITMGMDFYYRDAGKWFDNLDFLIQKVNELGAKERVHLLYSTPACYLQALRDEHGARVGPSSLAGSFGAPPSAPAMRWPVKIDDFFPYADVMNAYWTGYFTSRPALKLHMKYASNLATVAKQLTVLAGGGPSAAHRLRPLKEALAILQHHDAITGTCKQYVADDYHRMLWQGIGQAQEVVADCLQRLMRRPAYRQTAAGAVGSGARLEMATYVPRVQFCHQLNTSRCAASEDFTAAQPAARLIVLVYNPIGHELKHYLRVPVGNAYLGAQLTVRNEATGQLVEAQVRA